MCVSVHSSYNYGLMNRTPLARKHMSRSWVFFSSTWRNNYVRSRNLTNFCPQLSKVPDSGSGRIHVKRYPHRAICSRLSSPFPTGTASVTTQHDGTRQTAHTQRALSSRLTKFLLQPVVSPLAKTHSGVLPVLKANRMYKELKYYYRGSITAPGLKTDNVHGLRGARGTRICDTWLGLTSRAAHTAARQTLQRLCAPAASRESRLSGFLICLRRGGEGRRYTEEGQGAADGKPQESQLPRAYTCTQRLCSHKQGLTYNIEGKYNVNIM